MSALMSKFVLTGFFAVIIGCGTNEQIERNPTSSQDYGSTGSHDNADASIDLNKVQITEEKFEKKEQEGEHIFTSDIMSQLIGRSLEENDQPSQTSNKVIDLSASNSASQPKQLDQAEDTSESLNAVTEEDEQELSTEPELAQSAPSEDDSEELADEYNEEKYLEAMSLAQAEMQSKVEAMIPNAPSFMKNKLKLNADELLFCGDDCEDRAKALMVTSYSISRFLDSRGLALTATDIDAAIAAGGKLLSDIALIIVEATSPNPDPTSIIMLVDIFISDLRELIMAFLQ